MGGKIREYTSRESRHKFIADRFAYYLTGSVANIGGGGEKHLLEHLNPREYMEIDIAGKPDLLIDIDREFPLPIADGQFDAIVCTDVLEHLDELHRAFEELLRIARKYVIISLPNPILEFRNYLRRRTYSGDAGKAGVDTGLFTKFYGLPIKKPLDRHRWFFSYSEALHFFRENSERLNYEVLEEFPIGGKSRSLTDLLARNVFRLVFGKDAMRDFFYEVYWCVIGKRGSSVRRIEAPTPSNHTPRS